MPAYWGRIRFQRRTPRPRTPGRLRRWHECLRTPRWGADTMPTPHLFASQSSSACLGAPALAKAKGAGRTRRYSGLPGTFRAARQSDVGRSGGEQLADGEGFEPSRRLRACRFSRPVPSTTRPPILRLSISNEALGASLNGQAPRVLPFCHRILAC